MAMTMDELLRDLGALGEELSDPQSILTEIAEPIVAEMKRTVPVLTGDLRNSIGYVITGNTVQFTMLEYGMYVNYGVGPNQFTTTPKSRNPAGVLRRPWAEPDFGVTMGSGYSLPREFGMMARPFYSLELINTQIIDGIADFTANF
tara:strand:- start:46 stop:483 length:438 start_codon:yes stop_codon:yes gene_type:complete